MTSAARREHWAHRFQEVLDRPDVLRHGDWFLFRPGELLVHTDDEEHLQRHLEPWGGRLREDSSARLARHGIPVRVYRLGDEHAGAVPDVVQRLRGVLGTRELHVAPNHVFTGAPGYTPGGAGTPVPAPPPDGVETSVAADGDPVVSILDTGLPEQLTEWHRPLAEAAVPADPDGPTVDVLDGDQDGLLDLEAGHGTFVAGMLRQDAPWARFAVERVLEPCGIGDEVEIADALARTSTPIVNMSLGTYTHDDQPPMVLADAVASMGAGRLVVASAGNGDGERPTWPAALPGVVGVGALGRDGTRAEFSNYGDWVDACAPAVDVEAAYVFGRYPLPDGQVEQFQGWARWSGTSFAVPRVVAAIANRMREQGGTARQAWESLCGEEGRAWVPGLGAVFPG